MPLGNFFLLAAFLVLPAFAGGNGECGDAVFAWKGSDLGLCAQIADQCGFIYAAAHAVLLCLGLRITSTALAL